MKVTIYKDLVFISRLDIAPCLHKEFASFFDKHPKAVVCGPRLEYKTRVIDTFRNFPKFSDLIIKNTGFLRRRYVQRMRRYLLWDINMEKSSMVDFVTSDFLVIRKDFWYEYACNINWKKPNADVLLASRAWKSKKQVWFMPKLLIELKSYKSKKSLKDIFEILFFTARFHLLNIFTNFKSPSTTYKEEKQRVLRVHDINSRSYLKQIGSSFQKHNQVVQIYEGQVDGAAKYVQPLVFAYHGVLAVLVNDRHEFGLIRIWRHAPLDFQASNLFPVFPDNRDLGMHSLECVRGGAEKSDSDLKESILRELEEEIGLGAKHIKSVKQLSKLVSNTAWDVSSTSCFVVRSKAGFEPKLQLEESISSFDFYTRADILKLIKENKIFCGLTRAALLEVILMYD